MGNCFFVFYCNNLLLEEKITSSKPINAKIVGIPFEI